MTDAVVTTYYVLVHSEGAAIEDGAQTRLYAEVWTCGEVPPPPCHCDWTGKDRQYRPNRALTQARTKFIQGPHPVFSRGKKSFFDEV